jgi:plasmid replication initiation protein
MNDNYLVTKANTLITSNYDLSLEEQRIILTLASTVQPNDEDFKPYKFSIKEFIELLGIEDKRKYSRIPKITKELMQKVLEIKKGDDIIQVGWLSSAHYRKGTGTVELEFSPKLKPFMLGLKEFYTSYRLKNVLELKGKYSIRMYEILKSNEFKKVTEISIDELRQILKADSGSYLVYQNFKNRIICKSQRELEEKTDIAFKFKEIKTGRKVTSLKFYIKTNSKNNDEYKLQVAKELQSSKESKYIDKIKSIMDDSKITHSEASKIYESSNGDMDTIKKVYEYLKNKQLDNLIGAMISMVKPGVFIEPKQNTCKVNFNDYEQREYDFDNLEKKLLGIDNEANV